MIAWLYILGALLITVFFHELAHMIAALLCGVKVEVFSIGFGKPLFHKKLWGIDFRFTPLLLGGYCRLQGEKSKVKEGWLIQPYSKKVIIVLAGVITNLLIAFLCYWINFKSISFGLKLDFLLLKYIIAKDQYSIWRTVTMLAPNIFILQLGILNLVCTLNIIPFPALDGSYIWLFLLEPIFKEKFPIILEKIVKIGFVILLILQFVLLYWLWFV